MDDRLSPQAGEDALTIPESWRRFLHPRRGGTPGPEIRPARTAPEAARALVDAAGTRVARLLDGEAGEPRLAEAARRHLDGTPDPVGAAAVADAASAGTRSKAPAAHRAFVDAWTVEHGPAFAACALVELDRIADRPAWGVYGADPEAMRRMRGLLAAATDRDHEDAVERLAAHRTTPQARWLVSYLVPARLDWLDECLEAPGDPGRDRRWQMYCTLGDPSRLPSPSPGLGWRDASRGVFVTMADGMGTAVLPFLLQHADRRRPDEQSRLVFETVAVLPSDEAFQAILDRLGHKHARPALIAAMERFPLRAVRLLAAAGTPEATLLLEEHVRAHREAVTAALPALPPEVRAVAGPIAASSAGVPEAEEAALPALLADPPWRRPRRPAVAGLEPPAGRMAWAEGERDEWAATGTGSVDAPRDPDWEALAERYRSGGGPPQGTVALMVHGPETVVRPLLPGWPGRLWWDTGQWMRVLIARYGLDAFPVTLRAVDAAPSYGELLMPVLHADAALAMADWLARRTKTAGLARRWLGRHGLDAVPYLVPAALGTAAGQRRAAESALRHLGGAHGHAGNVEAARNAHGAEAADAIGELLAAHPAETGLVRPPKIGAWADPAVLPQVLLRGRGKALPGEAVRRLLELLAMPVPYGMEEVRRVCDPESVAGFGWALFQKWREIGGPSKDGWALTQLGRSGDDATVRLLTPVIRAWPGEGGHKNAVNGLGVLAEIGSDVALMHLHGIAQKIKFKGLQAEAQARIREVADRLGLSTEQLADRLVPDFGLDADGSMTLDYGPRRFRVGFDEQLKPTVADEDGTPRKSLPKPGAKDDLDLAPAAHKAFAALKKDVRTVASSQLLRLERAMVTQREWTAAEFREFIVGHPLVRHLARRLVWTVSGGDSDGAAGPAFRVAEDRTFADIEDDAYTLPDTARVRIAHPVHLDVAAWSELFADYGILQPFPQLGRPVHALTDKERDGERLERFEGAAVPFGAVAGLVRLGWERGAPQGGGNETWISRPVPGGRHVVIGLHPGLSAGELGANGDHQTLEHVWLAPEPGEYRHRGGRGSPLRLGDLDPVTASEVLAELTALTAGPRNRT
ncbi:DUF4132 domain-containing protein [Actinomadura graeca]|uniref:DUF4132 domain-containing protein n=1 Tax=Actinomadura graeca TaxID=2750812 RepID=A0ABX8QNI5_9ACTN|nr:DUF4132 domain-containing protein [Actinomadura graeca]QXJ20345.1 DUF4132 domain-containing protein [Actinomadura graeca]